MVVQNKMSLSSATAEEAARAAKLASNKLAILSAGQRNDALVAIHDALKASKDDILAANLKDMQAAETLVSQGKLSQSLVKRLDLSRPGKFDDMLKGVLEVRDLPDPLGMIAARTLLDDGLILERKSCPIGVLLIIFEARPEVIANIASLAIKSGNAAILKGGKESTESFKAIAQIISNSLTQTAVPNEAIQLVTSRAEIQPLLQLDRYVDLVIPRGGNELVRSIKSGTQIPVLGHADGLCCAYLRADADTDVATKVLLDSKCGYPAACNALETLLVDEEALQKKLPAIANALLQKGVSLRCDAASKQALQSQLDPHQAALIQDATDADYDTEFLDLILAVKTVPKALAPEQALDAAVAHINSHSSHHTDIILTSSQEAAEVFLRGVDSAGVYWNASTRFADGQRYGFGTEVGISTNKIHARGPVGLEGLTIYKWLLRGNGHTANDYGASRKAYKHQKLPILDVNNESVARDEAELELLRRHRQSNGVNGHA